MINSSADLNGLFDGLSRLDAILRHAVSAADATFGAGAAADPYRGLYIAPEDVQRLLAREPGTTLLSNGESSPVCRFPALQRLALRFDLSEFDQDAILVALAPEIDSRYERLYAYLQDDVTKKKPTTELLLALLCDSRDAKIAARSRFAAEAPLVVNKIVQLMSEPNTLEPTVLSQYVKLDPAVVRYLLGQVTVDSRVTSFCRLVPPSDGSTDSAPHPGLMRLEVIARQRRETGAPLRLYFKGSQQGPKLNAAVTLSTWLKAPLFIVDVARLLGGDWEATLPIAFLQAALHDGILYFEDCDLLNDAAPLLRALQTRLLQYTGVCVLEGRTGWRPRPVSTLTVVFSETMYEQRRQIWTRELAAAHVDAGTDMAHELAERYRLSEEEIQSAVATLASQALLKGSAATANDVFEAAREQCRSDIGPMAQRINPAYAWNDLVLAADQREQLQEIVAHVRYRREVYSKWGFERKLSHGKGLTALFSGPPGTGKTMAAEVIAAELKLDLYRIDLSQIVSKYIGETEKNLSKIFHEAGGGSCVLCFDECDALFGKRTEVKDAHDRYANIEVAYLLQRIDDYEGLCILATNLRQNLDPAFIRRIRFILDIDFPDTANREAIWERVWPNELPLHPDVDPAQLARQFRFSGGSIRNVALSAAFLAASENSEAVAMTHVVRAARRELEKTGHNATYVEAMDGSVREEALK